MNFESYEFDARKRWDFSKEDQDSQIDDSWFAHHKPDPRIFSQAASEEEFKLRLPVTPEREAGYRRLETETETETEVEVEHGRNDSSFHVQELAPLHEQEIPQEIEVVHYEQYTRDEVTIASNTLPEIVLKPSKATHPPRVKHQSVFDRLRSDTVASAGKHLKQTTIQKKHPSRYTKKDLKKKLVSQTKLTTNSNIHSNSNNRNNRSNSKKSQENKKEQTKPSNNTKREKALPNYMKPTLSTQQTATKSSVPLAKTLRSSHPEKSFTAQHIKTTSSSTTTTAMTNHKVAPIKNRQRTTSTRTSSQPSSQLSSTSKSVNTRDKVKTTSKNIPHYMLPTISTNQQFASKQNPSTTERAKKTPVSIKARSLHKSSSQVTLPLAEQPHYMLPTISANKGHSDKSNLKQGIKRQSSDLSNPFYEIQQKKQKRTIHHEKEN